jgi:hypothetical protein
MRRPLLVAAAVTAAAAVAAPAAQWQSLRSGVNSSPALNAESPRPTPRLPLKHAPHCAQIPVVISNPADHESFFTAS